MFRALTNASFRRSLHTSSRSSVSTRSTRLHAVLGASAVATSYIVWNSWYGQRIALDAPPSSSKQVPLRPKTSTSPEAISHSPSKTPEHEPSIHPENQNSALEAAAEGAQADSTTEGEESTDSGGGGGAFNPETGEINWDCPCLGGMAHGPCGMQFREAFQCFVFSEADPKGIDCVEKFKAMQECFREHPDVYGDDIMNDDEDEEAFAPEAAPSVENPTERLKQTEAVTAASESSTPSSSSQAEAPSTEQKKKPRKAPSSSQ